MGAFEEVADGLYGVLPGEFTAARDEAVARARQDGERGLAAQIKALRKPTLPAFALNRLVRRHREEVEALLELGRGLREAQARLAGPELRELSARRHRLVAALTEQARRAAAEVGEHLGEAQLRLVEQSLRAALADERAAEALAAGRLSGPLEETGALPTGTAKATATGAAARSRSGAGRGRKVAAGSRSEEAARRASALREARERVVVAEAVLADAEEAKEAAGREAERLASDTAAAAEHARRARAALERAERRLAGARGAEQTGREEQRAAREKVREAGAALGRERERLEELERRGGP
ncbi:hypothetical protein [Kitasatospora cheerisanensis]|uniref:Uncharacterized protein n=1 Tax=Kitasatospora cheerisanensis KCTC 2395 TaxID=1348663 RepID=A0A066YRS8_9ACTN|nr:hypothetical protein [Kitasatospora cheerisanensis]KDN80635.1 hypothetical protein KCH_76110 [Kitasatospora cheerisanensis KCTC 2395]